MIEQKFCEASLCFASRGFDAETATLYNLALGNEDELAKFLKDAAADYMENTTGVTQEKLDTMNKVIENKTSEGKLGIASQLEKESKLSLLLPQSIKDAAQIGFEAVKNQLTGNSGTDSTTENTESEFGGGTRHSNKGRGDGSSSGGGRGSGN